MCRVKAKEMSKDTSQISSMGCSVIDSVINGDKSAAGGVGSK